MPSISMTQFAKFYESKPAGQVVVVREIRMQLADPPTEPNYYMKHNFYGLFLLKLRQTHWASHDIQDFEDSLPSFVRGLSPNPPKDTDGRREESGRGVRELQGK